jgi:hypothetical protein
MESTEAVWRERIRQFRESGLTAREFAARNGFHATTLSRWKRELTGKGDPPATGLTLARVGRGGDREVVVSSRRDESMLEVVIRGVVVRVRRGFDRDVLRAVVAALAEVE